jgi:SAM-dependent methyltransferase
VSDPRTTLVGEGYDVRAAIWDDWAAQIEDDTRLEWLAQLTARVPAGEAVVELGCGGGTVETRALAERYRLTGIDLSGEQLRRARERVPDATFVQADFTSVELTTGSLGAVAAFYSFNHVPRELLAPLLGRIHGWLRPGGVLLTAFGTGDEEAWYGDFLGAPTFFSSFPAEVNSQLVRDAGFELVRDEVLEMREPEGPVSFQWVLAIR